MTDLQSLCVLVTRPSPEGNQLCEKIEALGGRAIHFPTLAFAPPLHPIRQKRSADFYDWIIFVSPRAVEWGLHWAPVSSQKTRVAAIGDATARALQAAGLQEVIVPKTDWTSEGLLALPEFLHPAQQKILLVSGEGGRETLASTLVARKAVVHAMPVYRRIRPDIDTAPCVLLLQQKKIDITVCTSGESLHNLLEMTGEAHRSRLQEIPLLVIGERQALLASRLGFQKIFSVKNASHSMILDGLKGMGHVQSRQ